MNKALLHEQIFSELEMVYKNAIDSAQRAYDTAIDEENEAENKYDTMGLEASYLAHGQSQRVNECKNDLVEFKKLKALQFSPETPISLGALIYIADDSNHQQCLFLSPVAGGLKIFFQEKEVTLVTPSSPLGKALSSSMTGDEIEIMVEKEKKYYEITAVY
ncbi:MAG: GreA/GreB family elongation factor [Gammaproteobacteria bacterium]|nr:GreA/GreB family elongation factor [Gammaproteobacteria bacterium]